MMMKCESMTNSYAKYIQFFRTFDARDGTRKRKTDFLSLLSMCFIVSSCLNALTTHVAVCVCHAALKGYLFTYLLT